jgi:hypothetical protein
VWFKTSQEQSLFADATAKHTPTIIRTGPLRLHNNEANPSIYTKCFAFLPPFPTDNKIFLFHLREVHTHSDGDQQQGHGDRVQAALLVSHRRHLLSLGVLGCVGVNLQRKTAFFSVFQQDLLKAWFR